jgi:hypothetical protein
VSSDGSHRQTIALYRACHEIIVGGNGHIVELSHRIGRAMRLLWEAVATLSNSRIVQGVP